MNPSWRFVLCESTTKKTNFLIHLVKELSLEKNIRIENVRVEAYKDRSTKFDLVTARAVAKLNELINYAMPLLKENGCLIAYKAKDIASEIKAAEKLIKKNDLKLTVFSKEINKVERKLVVLSNPSSF